MNHLYRGACDLWCAPNSTTGSMSVMQKALYYVYTYISTRNTVYCKLFHMILHYFEKALKAVWQHSQLTFWLNTKEVAWLLRRTLHYLGAGTSGRWKSLNNITDEIVQDRVLARQWMDGSRHILSAIREVEKEVIEKHRRGVNFKRAFFPLMLRYHDNERVQITSLPQTWCVCHSYMKIFG